jgi:NAD(P)-dependent dehydrogenase (short-subunit alcohol dehydrogenase family)
LEGQRQSTTDWDTAVSAVVDEWGGIDLLANVAGVTQGVDRDGSDSVLNLTEDVWEHTIGTNLKSVWLGMRSVIPHMIAAGGGRIVNTSLMSAQRGSRATAAVKPRPLGSCRPPAAVFLGAVLGGALGCACAFVIGRAEHPIGGMPLAVVHPLRYPA